MDIFNNSSTGQFILNHKGIVLKANSSFGKTVGLDDSDKVRKISFSDFIFEDDKDNWCIFYGNYFSGNVRNRLINIRYYKHGNCNWWKISLDKIDIGSKSYVLGVAVDISSEMESQDDLLEAKKAAEKSEASKSIFLANMSHEIRTPIHTVTGLSELLSETELDGEQTEYVSQIDFAAKVLLTLINDILDFSKIEAGKLTFENIEYNLYDTIINSVDLSALEAHKKGVDVAISIDNDMPHFIVGDQVRLRQVIVNLMSNAVKFTKTGEIILDVTTKVNHDTTILKIAVSDSGIGISKEKQARLFQAFSQADASTTRQFGGTGLGLSISSSLVQMMGGKIAVKSEVGKGATFFFEIPITRGHDHTPIFIKPPIADLKVLVVDDNKEVNRVFSSILRNWNYSVVEVYSSKDALNELIIKATTGVPYDLCFIDQILPGMDGWQLASEIHSNPLIKTTKTLLMSLKGKGIEEAKMKLLGWFQGYLTKPVSEKELYSALDELYSRTREVDIDNIEDDDIEELESLGDEVEELVPLETDNSEIEGPKTPLLANIVANNNASKPVKNILVVEDHLVNQKLFKIILEKANYKVYCASDGLEAVNIVEEHELDLVFMDCQMPVMNGYDSSEQIRLNGYKIPIIAVTASAVKGEYEKCINSGMNDVMTKPFKKEDVMASIEKWINKKGEEILLFDYDKALERFMGDKDILMEVMPPFLENLNTCLGELKTIDGTANTKRVRELAHSIKGSSLNLDIVPLGEAADTLEEMAYNNETDGLSEKINALEKVANLTIEELKKYL